MEKHICTFDRAQYLAGQNISITFPFELKSSEIKLYRLHEEVPCKYTADEKNAVIACVPIGNYGVSVTAGDYYWEGAFDMVPSQRVVTRYGFLSDFTPEDTDTADVSWMRNLHLNAVQFYDWMYRHDELISPTEDYSDPLGRKMSIQTIRRKIEACKAFGIRSFAYGAIYAATKETFLRHPDWGMYTMDGTPMLFADWLHYMNVAEECGWTNYLLGQYIKVIEFGFSGIHMDTYGFPKRVWDSDGKPVELDAAFPKLIDRAAAEVSCVDADAGVIFNAVNNWPTDTVADTAQDAVYVEVWPPNDTYYDLYTIIKDAKSYADKPVVLAAYMKPFQNAAAAEDAERALRLTWAAISASGGTQLVFGERESALQDSYYVNYASLRNDFLPTAQRYCDFLVRYADLMYDDKGIDISKTASGGINEDVCFKAENCEFSVDAKAGTVWTILRESVHRLTLHLINLRGNDVQWNMPKQKTVPADNIQLRLRLDRKLRGIYNASPDGKSLKAIELDFTCEMTPQGRIYSAEITTLDYWTTVWVEVEE